MTGVIITVAFLASRVSPLEFASIEGATPQQLAAGEILGAQRYKDGLIAGMSKYGVQVPQTTIDLVERLIQQAGTSYDGGDFEGEYHVCCGIRRGKVQKSAGKKR